jgi:hypothetical protein
VRPLLHSSTASFHGFWSHLFACTSKKIKLILKNTVLQSCGTEMEKNKMAKKKVAAKKKATKKPAAKKTVAKKAKK